MSEEWPAVRPAPSALRLLVGTALALITVVLVATAFDGLPDPRPVWWPVTAVLGVVVVVPSVGYGWWTVLRGTMRQTVPGVRLRSAGTWPERRRRRRTLLAGGALDDDDRRRIAVELAAASPMPWLTALLGSVTGTNLLSTSGGGGSTWVVVVLGLLPALGVPILVATMLRLRPVERAARAIGVLPVVVPGSAVGARTAGPEAAGGDRHG